MSPLRKTRSPGLRNTDYPDPSNWSLIRRLVGLAWLHRWHCLRVLTFQILLVIMTLCGLSMTGLGVDYIRHVMDKGSRPPQWWFDMAPPAGWPPMVVISVYIAGGIILLVTTRSLLNYLRMVSVTQLIQQKVTVMLRQKVYDKLQRLSFRFFDQNDGGTIINRVTNDVQMTSKFLSIVLLALFEVIVTLSLYVGFMASIHVPLTLAVMATTPVLCIVTFIFTRLIRKETKVWLQLRDKLVSTLSENVQGVHVVKGFARQQEQIERFGHDNEAVHDQQHRIFWLTSIFGPLVTFMTQINLVVIFAYGGYLVVLYESDPLRGIPLGSGLLVFATLATQFSTQIQRVAIMANKAQECLTSADRVFEILDTPLEIQSPPDAVLVPRARGRVRFEAVRFGYRPEETVLHDIDFDVEPGACVAIVGPTGAGKTTLLSLIPRFYDPIFGRIMLDGTDLRQLDLDDLRRNIGLVFQESFLFSNSVAANIAFGHPDATPQQIENAAKIACAHEFIAELPDGYDTVIGERGCDLSGGQCQRLAIARAVLLEPPILLLDDPMAAIDPETEHDILRAIDNAMANRTTFVVAHRLSTLRRANQVIVLEKGQIVQVGTHAELLATKGHYRKVARLQAADEESKRLLGVDAGGV